MYNFLEQLEKEYSALSKEQQKGISLFKKADSVIELGMKPGELCDLVTRSFKEKEDLRVAMHEYKDHHQTHYSLISHLANLVLSGYEQHSLVKIKKDPDFENAVKFLSDQSKNISCVVHVNDIIFDPINLELWKQNIRPNDEIMIYLHNLNGKKHELGRLVTNLGRSIREKNPLLVDYYAVEFEYGIHARPSAVLVAAFEKYDPNIMVQVIGTDGNISKGSGGRELKCSGKSIMGMMTLEAECGKVIKIKYDAPQNEQDKVALKGVRSFVKKIMHSADESDLGELTKIIKAISYY